MADFQELDPETRCFALVGQFLQAWSVMEGALHNAIGAGLGIEDTKLQILCANIRFRDKVHILATLIDVAPYFAQADKEKWRKDLRELGNLAGSRNMMAHEPFHADESKTGVEFLTVKAKGKFDLPTVVWSAEQFQTEGELVDQYREFLDAMTVALEAQPISQRNYAAALRRFIKDRRDMFAPSELMLSPTPLDHLSPQSEVNPDLSPHPPSGETSAQTPQGPEE